MTTANPSTARQAPGAPGKGSVLRRLIGRLARLLYRRSTMVWLALDLKELQPRYTLRQRGLVVEPLGESNRAAFRRFRSDYPYKAGTRILDDVDLPGFRCFLAMQEGEVHGAILLGTADYHYQEPRLQARIPEGDACVFGIWITPDRRGKMTAGPLVEAALLYYKAQGFRRATGFTDQTNRASLGVTARFGFQEKNEVRFHRLLSIQLRPNRKSRCDP